MSGSRISNPTLFICDVQEKFRDAIWEFPRVVSTAQKMVKASKAMNIPIYLTTQNAARLGPTVAEITSILPQSETHASATTTATEIDKTAFSMCTPELLSAIKANTSANPANADADSKMTVLLLGIETHICVTQTTLDLLASGHKVYILADGVSSINAGERGIALDRLRAEGATVTTSESVIFELLADAKDKRFREVSGIVKETKEETKKAVEVFCNFGGSRL